MKISLDWISQYVDFSDVSPETVANRLTMATAEVEGVEIVGDTLNQVIVGEVLSCEAHPDADRLSVTQVAFGADEAGMGNFGGEQGMWT